MPRKSASGCFPTCDWGWDTTSPRPGNLPRRSCLPCGGFSLQSLRSYRTCSICLARLRLAWRQPPPSQSKGATLRWTIDSALVKRSRRFVPESHPRRFPDSNHEFLQQPALLKNESSYYASLDARVALCRLGSVGSAKRICRYHDYSHDLECCRPRQQ